MGGVQFIDIGASEVVDAGRRTADTAPGWAGWGQRSRVVFQDARVDVRGERLAEALADYAAVVVARATVTGQRVSALGADTTAAATTVEQADQDGAELMTGQSSLLARPLNGAPAPVDGHAVVR